MRSFWSSWSNTLSAGYCILVCGIAFFAYVIVPDNSPWGSFQCRFAANLPPFSTVSYFVEIPPDDQLTQPKRTFWEILLKGNTAKAALRPRLTPLATSTPVTQTFLLGTDMFGRDVFSRIVIGGRVSLATGFIGLMISLVLGVLLGGIGGYFGGWIDAFILWITQITWTLPAVLLAVGISFVLGKGFWPTTIAIGLSLWVDVARVVRGQVLTLKEKEFIKAGKLMGLHPIRLLLVHILPNLKKTIIILGCTNFGTAILLESGLSFLGLGVSPPQPAWGSMIYEGFSTLVLESGKWITFFTGLTLVLFIICLNLVANGITRTRAV